jgi:hypothetical protein
MPFGQADIAMVSNAIDRRLQSMSPPPMMQPNQVAGNQAPEAQQIRGTMSQMQRSQQEREQADQMAQAKIAETQSRAMLGGTRAEYAPAMAEADIASKQARTGQTQASTDLTQARAASAQVEAKYAPARQEAMLARLKADADNNKAGAKEKLANVKRKLAEVDVLIGLTPEEAKAAQAERDAQETSPEPAPSSQQQSKPMSKVEVDAYVRSQVADAGIEMENTGDIRNDVNNAIARLNNAQGMLANNLRNKLRGIIQNLKNLPQ